MKNVLFFAAIVFFITSCEREPLKIYNRAEEVNGEKVYETIRDFSFTNQDSVEVTNATYTGKVYVSNNFFTTCPSICPTVSSQLLRIYEKFENDDRLLLLSRSIDVQNDSVAVLKRYAEGLEVKAPKWNFVTGDEEKIFEITYDYFSTALKDETAPGGFDHDDLIVLVDKNGHIRSFAHGTDPKAVDKFIEDIEFLLKSEY